MVLHLIINNFGKVESADILLDNLMVFVGNNNSGKTMVMQLLYGIRKELVNFPAIVSGAKQSELNGQNLIRCDQKWFREAESRVNVYLAEKKQQIIENIFGMPISVGEIKIALDGTESAFFVCSVSEYQDREADERQTRYSIDIRQYENGEIIKSYKNQISAVDGPEAAVSKTLESVWKIILSEDITSHTGQLFLPASRSGLQLLYKHYFVGATEGNLVLPIKEFLHFLQLYDEDKQLCESRKGLLEFGEEHLLQGKIVQKGEETFYVDRQGERAVLLHIASSMIHELTPFIKALGAMQRIDWLYCDEVENSLHPLLQREMARWLIRMVNAGLHVVISSHSDTMASRLNNLFMLTKLVRDRGNYGVLSELNLMEADLLQTDVTASVYEFREGRHGKTEVEKLEFISYPLMGYDFQLFGKNLDKLYDEAERITR